MGCRWLRRLVAVGSAGLCAASLASAVAASPLPGVTVTPQVGFGGQFRPGSWTPIRLLITGGAPPSAPETPATGSLNSWQGYVGLVITRPGTLAGVPIVLTYRTPVVVANPARLQLDFIVPLLSAYDSIRWQLWDSHGKMQQEGVVPVLARAADQPVWLIFQERASSATNLAWTATGDRPVRLQFLTDPQECPTDALYYDGVDVIVADQFAWARLLPRAWAALRGWVQTGGLLLVTEAAWRATQPAHWLGAAGAKLDPASLAPTSPSSSTLSWQPAGLGWVSFAPWSLGAPPWSQAPGQAYAWLQAELPRSRTQRRPIVPLSLQVGRAWQPPLDHVALSQLIIEPLVWPSRLAIALAVLAYLASWILFLRWIPTADRPTNRRWWSPTAWGLVVASGVTASVAGAGAWVHSWQSLSPSSRVVRVALGRPDQDARWLRTYLVEPNPQPQRLHALPVDPAAATGVMPLTDLYPVGNPPLGLTGQARDPLWQLEMTSDGGLRWRGRTSLAALVSHQIVADNRLALAIHVEPGSAARSGQIRNRSSGRFAVGMMLNAAGSAATWALLPGQSVAWQLSDEVSETGSLARLSQPGNGPWPSPAWTTLQTSLHDFWHRLEQQWPPARQLAHSEQAYLPRLAADLAAVWLPTTGGDGPALVGWEWGGSSPAVIYLYDLRAREEHPG